MKKIEYTKDFIKHFKLRITSNRNLERKAQERIALFLKDRTNPILRDHQLIGRMKRYRSFSVAGDCRIIYYEKKENIIFVFVDIGSHNQIYK